MTQATDLFGHPMGPDQLSLFGPGENRLQPPKQNFMPDPAKLRRQCHAVLEQARNARKMPWPEREAQGWETVFPNWTNFLPDDEAAGLRAEFAREIERLKAAA